MQTAFYIVGGSLVLIALIISFIGMRSDSFPSATMLRVGIVFVALVVATTAVFAVKASNDEKSKREHEENVEASAEEAADNIANQQVGNPEEGGGSTADTGDAGAAGGGSAADAGKGDPEAGAQVFSDAGCGGCHTLQAAADATAQLGPNLDEALVDKDMAFIETSIIDPSAEIEEGFNDGTMPQDFGDRLSPQQLADLVAYLYQSTHGGAGN